VSDGEFPAIIRNEFAIVVVSLVPSASGLILQIKDETSGRTATFDAMELEALVWLTPADRQRMLSSDHRYAVDESARPEL
jgi:hypothetical protein